ncbi:MAG: IS66 family insertion sequence element accessory protein TnpB [Faecalibacterium sp.]
MLKELQNSGRIYIVTGRTDMRKGINGLANIIQQNYQMNPYESGLFLFCGRKRNKLKALLWEPDGFVLLCKQLSNGYYQWPRSVAEVRALSSTEYIWLLQGLSIEQPKAIRATKPKKLI